MYTSKIKAPIYEIKGDKPRLDELVKTDKFKELIENIDKAVAPEGVKKFLRMAAARHLQFDYAKIAEYYANSPANVQELMEQSGLVIVDFDSAIENGFVQMNKKLMEIRKNEPTS